MMGTTSTNGIGIAKPISNIQFADRYIVESSALHYSVLSVKAELNQLATGLRALGVLDMVQANPKLLRPLFVHNQSPPPLNSAGFGQL